MASGIWKYTTGLEPGKSGREGSRPAESGASIGNDRGAHTGTRVVNGTADPLTTRGLGSFSARVSALLVDLLRDSETLERELAEVRMLVRQTQNEEDRWRAEEKAQARLVQDMELNLDDYRRTDIAGIYGRRIELQMRAAMLHTQADRLEIRRNEMTTLQSRIERIVSILQSGMAAPIETDGGRHDQSARIAAEESEISEPGASGGISTETSWVSYAAPEDTDDAHRQGITYDAPLWRDLQFRTARVAHAQEEVRYRVARDMCDGPAHALTNLVLRAEICYLCAIRGEAEGSGTGEARTALSMLKDDIRRVLEDVRALISELHPMILDDLGLAPAIGHYIKCFTQKHGIQVTSSVGELGRFSGAVEMAAFRILQETLQNVAQHAKAQHVQIFVEARESQIMLRIEDDGKGFDLRAIASHEGYDGHDNGIGNNGESDSDSNSVGGRSRSAVGPLVTGVAGMKQLAAMFEGGKLAVESSPGAGTSVVAHLPTHPVSDSQLPESRSLSHEHSRNYG